jgi:hypothetical protein
MERFCLKKLYEVEGEEQYRGEISNRLEKLGDEVILIELGRPLEIISKFQPRRLQLIMN